jgi:hypothetical protein
MAETVLISTDSGLESFNAQAVKLDEIKVPHNLLVGTEYAVLDSHQTKDYFDGNAELRLEDELRYLGAFSLLFTSPPSEVQSQTI